MTDQWSDTAVIVGGFSTPSWVLSGLVRTVNQSGVRARAWCHRLGLACSEETVEALALNLREREGDRHPVLIGFSRGAHFCEVLARRRPAALRGVISLGGPSVREGPLSGVNGSVRRRIVVLGKLGSHGLSGVVTDDCLESEGGCCGRFWEQVGAPEPLPIPHRVVAADKDRVVRRLNLRPDAEPDATIGGGHASLLRSAPMRRVLSRLIREILSPA